MEPGPDILVRYDPARNVLGRGQDGSECWTVIYVRPETNTVLYERAIMAGVRAHGTLAYAANLNGSLFRRDRILEGHYASQFRFATDPCPEIVRYPEMARRFEEHFGSPPDRARLVGAFAGEAALAASDEELFETIVPECDFLACWGQEFKRVGELIIANPNLPAVVKRYTPEANVFVAVARCAAGSPRIFEELNRSIYDQVTSRRETPILDGDKLGSLSWSERIRRTYHISTNHLMAMFDMADLLYVDERSRLDLAETPLGRVLASGAVTEQALRKAKAEQLVYLGRGEGETLVYLPEAAEGMGIAEIERMLASARLS